MNRIKLYEAFSKSIVDEFCKDHLIDLIDEGWRVEVNIMGMDLYLNIYRDGEVNRNLYRKWSEIKDIIITFFEVFITKYYIRQSVVFHGEISSKNEYHYHVVDEVISDRIDNDILIRCIGFRFNKLEYKD